MKSFLYKANYKLQKQPGFSARGVGAQTTAECIGTRASDLPLILQGLEIE
jgi:hypothetical protein